MDKIGCFKFDKYSNFGIRLGRFALSFNALKFLPDNEKVLYKLMVDKIKNTKFDPFLFAIRQKDVDIFVWITKHRQMEDKNTYLGVAKYYNCYQIEKVI